MASTDGLFSVRIVVADFYLHRPTPELDPTYSEYRGKEIRSVPIVRIFGSNKTGDKICMHIHGVFPYFYIPYEENVASADVDQLTYQIAVSVDKAINVSLGQTHSQQQHVYKIQLVKGIPFYGYHRNEHQFLKIFLYNPRFIKKAANFFQNGAILGKVFQPHESHVPYILQFLIDYNLYGMSFLHAPEEIVKYRQGEGFQLEPNLSRDQILDSKIARLSTSQYEVDIAAAFILNRFQLLSDNVENANPGIEAIWQDERARREKIVDDQEIPPLEIPSSQERIDVRPTESEIFYKTALRTKLSIIADADSSLNLSTAVSSEKKSKFNLSKLLVNSVYPSECSQDKKLMLANASGSNNSILSESLYQKSMRSRSKSRSSLSTDSSSFIDEELVLSLSQPQQNPSNDTLKDEDLELLEVMQQLEEEDEAGIDLDSTLAPLSQTIKAFSQQTMNDVDDKQNESQEIRLVYSDDDDEDDPNDYTIAVDDTDQIMLALSQSILTTSRTLEEKLPQLDGGDDLLATPKKCRTTRSNLRMKKSPRSPKVSKYAPLDVTICKSPKAKITKPLNNGHSSMKTQSLFAATENKTRTPTPLQLKRVQVNLTDEFRSSKQIKFSTKLEKHSRVEDYSVANGNGVVKDTILDQKSFIVCALKPRNTRSRGKPSIISIPNEKQVDKISSMVIPKYQIKKCKVKLKRLRAKQKSIHEESHKEKSDHGSEIVISDSGENPSNEQVNYDAESHVGESIMAASEEKVVENYSQPRELNKMIDEDKSNNNTKDFDANGFLKPKIRAVEVLEVRPRRKSFSPCEIAREFDRERNFFPKAGTSGYKKNKRKRRTKKAASCTESTSIIRTRSKCNEQAAPVLEVSETLSLKNNSEVNASEPKLNSPEIESDEMIGPSHFDKSLTWDASSFFCDSPGVITNSPPERSPIQSILSVEGLPVITIRPENLPPTYAEVTKQLADFNIPDNVYSNPFYGNENDVTSKREIGHTVLHIPGKSLNSIEQFHSLVPDLQGVDIVRKDMLNSIFGDEAHTEMRSTALVKQYFATEEHTTITPCLKPPSKTDARIWLMNFNKNDRKIEPKIEDSPIKIRQEKVKLILDGSINSGDDFSQRSISVSPFTPDNVKSRRDSDSSKSSKSGQVRSLTTPLSAIEKFKERRKSRARMSLAKKLQRESVKKLENSGINEKVSPNRLDNRRLQFSQEAKTDTSSNDSGRVDEWCSGEIQVNA